MELFSSRRKAAFLARHSGQRLERSLQFVLSSFFAKGNEEECEAKNGRVWTLSHLLINSFPTGREGKKTQKGPFFGSLSRVKRAEDDVAQILLPQRFHYFRQAPSLDGPRGRPSLTLFFLPLAFEEAFHHMPRETLKPSLPHVLTHFSQARSGPRRCRPAVGPDADVLAGANRLAAGASISARAWLNPHSDIDFIREQRLARERETLP